MYCTINVNWCASNFEEVVMTACFAEEPAEGCEAVEDMFEGVEERFEEMFGDLDDADLGSHWESGAYGSEWGSEWDSEWESGEGSGYGSGEGSGYGSDVDSGDDYGTTYYEEFCEAYGCDVVGSSDDYGSVYGSDFDYGTVEDYSDYGTVDFA